MSLFRDRVLERIVAAKYRVDRVKGFTIVELIVVIAVIGILTIISVVAYKNMQAGAKDSVIAHSLNDIEKAIAQYALKNRTIGYGHFSSDFFALRYTGTFDTYSGQMIYHGGGLGTHLIAEGYLPYSIRESLLEAGPTRGVYMSRCLNLEETKDVITVYVRSHDTGITGLEFRDKVQMAPGCDPNAERLLWYDGFLFRDHNYRIRQLTL